MHPKLSDAISWGSFKASREQELECKKEKQKQLSEMKLLIRSFITILYGVTGLKKVLFE